MIVMQPRSVAFIASLLHRAVSCMLLTCAVLALLCLCVLLLQPHAAAWSSLLCQELSLSPSSRELGELSCFRQSLATQHAFDADIARALQKLRVLFAKRATQQTKNLSRIRAIFSEAQFARFIEWSHRPQQQHAPQHYTQQHYHMQHMQQQQQQQQHHHQPHYQVQQFAHAAANYGVEHASQLQPLL